MSALIGRNVEFVGSYTDADGVRSTTTVINAKLLAVTTTIQTTTTGYSEPETESITTYLFDGMSYQVDDKVTFTVNLDEEV